MSEFGKKGYKAFDHGMVCRGKQYSENTVFEEQGAEDCCEAGVMHYCENPLDVLNYYPLIDDDMRLVEVAEVEPMAEVLRKEDKCATKKLRIGAKLSFKDYIKASVDFVLEKRKGEVDNDDYAQLAASGDSAKLAASGDSAQLAASGDSAKLAASGDSAKLAASGDSAQLAASGDSAKLAASSKNSVAAAIGASSEVKGAKGNWLVLAEWAWANGEFIPVCVKTVQVDGEKIKADTWYTLKNGEFVEV